MTKKNDKSQQRALKADLWPLFEKRSIPSLLIKGVAPFNTKNNEWVERIFSALVEEQNKASPDSVPTDLLS